MTLTIATFVITTIWVAWLTRVAYDQIKARRLFDNPNERSLHYRPVPRGGGLAIAAGVLVAQLVLIGFLASEATWFWAWLTTGVGFAALGWADDLQARHAGLRLLLQCVLAVWFAMLVVGARAPEFAGVEYAGFIASAVLIIGCVNLVNFMDGADGYATSGVGFMALVWVVFMTATGSTVDALCAVALVGGCIGFLIWNWAPAQIFMGDCGSYFLGFQISALLIIGADSMRDVMIWLIVVSPFLVDGAMTLTSRIILRERWWEAHRSHLYQRLILSGWSHQKTTLYLLLSLAVFCSLFAWWQYHWAESFVPVTLAVTALIGLWLAAGYFVSLQPPRAPEAF